MGVAGPGTHRWWYFQRLCRATCPEEHDCRTHPLISQLDVCMRFLRSPQGEAEGRSVGKGHPTPGRRSWGGAPQVPCLLRLSQSGQDP